MAFGLHRVLWRWSCWKRTPPLRASGVLRWSRQHTAKGLPQEQLAERVDLNTRTVQKIEAGKLNILLTTILRLQAALGCSWDCLTRRSCAVAFSAFASALRDRYSAVMTLEEIKASIPQLTLEERAEVARCLHEWEDDDWDQQMKRDLAAGKFDAILKKVDMDIEQGRLLDAP